MRLSQVFLLVGRRGPTRDQIILYTLSVTCITSSSIVPFATEGRKEGRKLSFVLLLLLRLNCLASLPPSFSWQPSIPIQCATFDMTVGVLACMAMYDTSGW